MFGSKKQKETVRTEQQINQEYSNLAVRLGDLQHQVGTRIPKQMKELTSKMDALDNEMNALRAKAQLAELAKQQEAAKLQAAAAGKKAEGTDAPATH